MSPIRPLDVEALRRKFNQAQPFRHFTVDGLLEPDFAAEAALAYPPFDQAWSMGFGFKAVNEHLKVQVTEYAKFPDAVKGLADALASPEFLRQLEEITGIQNLLWDPGFAGGGMHQTASSGLLDVHVDFNVLESHNLFRRLNLLLYLNPEWDESWGGEVELWDKEVKVRHHHFLPLINQAVVFETSDISFHGVTAVTSPRDKPRKSFAVYYYTKEPPPHWNGKAHSTIFKARPDEYLKRYVLMPGEKAQRTLLTNARSLKKSVQNILRSK